MFRTEEGLKGIIKISYKKAFLLLICCWCTQHILAQNNPPENAPIPEKDMSDVFRYILKKKVDSSKIAKPEGFAILPSFGYNPSFGFVIGAKASKGKVLGDPSNTNLSTVRLEALYTSKGIITAQVIHNAFTSGNKYNWQGNWQLSRFGITDYGLNSNNTKASNTGFVLNDYPVNDADSAFPIKYTYIRLSEKLYKKIGAHLYAGAGINVNIYSDIDDEKLSSTTSTPHEQYSIRNGYDLKKYSANGLIMALQYTTLDNPVRAYRGVYADVNFQFNQKWLGSTKNAVQFEYEFKKFWSLSKKNPAHVFAFWHWASFKVSGSLPYLDLASTGSDTYKRSGRAYTIGRFKGPSFAYFEGEYRFPITKNKLVSGVCFYNLQTASNDTGKKIFTEFENGYGAGLRILFQKQSRSTLCIDYGRGQYGSSGIFFGLNEVF